MAYSNTNVFDLSYTSANAAGTTAGTPITGLGSFKSLFIYAALTGATGGALDVYLQVSPDFGVTWVDYAHYVQIAAAATVAKKAFTVSRYGQQTTVTTVGAGTTASPGVALAANTVIGGEFGDRIRVVSVAGASTSAGAAQVIKIIGKE